MVFFAFLLLLGATLLAYFVNRRAAISIRAGGAQLHSLESFHGLFAALSVLVPVLIGILFWLVLERTVVDWFMLRGLPAGTFDDLDSGASQLIVAEIKSIAGGRVFGTPEPWKIEAAERLVQYHAVADWLLVALVAFAAALLLWLARRTVAEQFRARQSAERIVLGLMIFCATAAIFVTIGIVFALTFETIKFFQIVPLTEFLFGTSWEPQIPIREDQVAAKGAFGAVPVFLGTIVISVVALTVAVPVGLMTAIYLNEFAPQRVRRSVKPILEILAGVPTVVYGFFAVLTVAPAIRQFAASIGVDVAPNTALAAGGVMGIMLIPFISSFTDDALSAVPRSLRDGALALGATRGEMMLNVLFPAAIPGIVGGVLLAVSRAIGETMIVVMAAGLIAKMTINPLDSVTAVTVQIVTLLIGDTSFDNPKTLSAFALGMMLFLATLIINIFALRIVRKYREIYD